MAINIRKIYELSLVRAHSSFLHVLQSLYGTFLILTNNCPVNDHGRP